jgi:hypothetical protein
MSHYTVLVTKTNKVPLDDQLEPFDEGQEVGPYWVDCRCIGGQAKREAHDQTAEQLGKTLDDYRHSWATHSPQWRQRHSWDEFIKPYTDLAAKLAQEHPSYGKPAPDCDECTGSGRRQTTYNPDSKWDWFEVGGRWCGYLKLKPGATGELGLPGAGDNEPRYDADIAKAGDIDWEAMRAYAHKQAAAAWQKYQTTLASGEPCNPYVDYGVRPDDTRETYIARHGSAATYAVLHDGEWHAVGQMGWWGFSHDEQAPAAWGAEFEHIVSGLDPDDEVTVVDCHI